MALRRVSFVVVVVFLVLGTVGFGESQPRTQKFVLGPLVQTGFVVGQCSGFQVWTDGVALITGVDRFDKNGNWVQTVQQYRVLGESIYYNSVHPERAVAGGPGEVENGHLDATTGVISLHGLSFKVRIPGHGLIFAETGSSVFQCDPNTFENCEPVSNAGHNQFADGDLAALCDYLK